MAIRLDEARAVQYLGRLGHLLEAFPGELTKVVVASMNGVASKTRTRAVSMLGKRYAAPKESFNRKIKVDRATPGNLNATIYGAGRGIRLAEWPNQDFSVVKDNGRVYKGVQVKVLKEEGFKVVKGGFVGKSGGAASGKMIYRRKGESRLPIEGLVGPTVIGWFADEENLKALSDYAESKLEIVVQGVAKKRLEKLGLL
jgi:hypothetical protein